MSRRLAAAALFGALITIGSAAPGHGLVPHAAAASCTGWTSNTQPPPTIRVFRHVTGAVETVDFKAYTKNVLSREWISSWTTESLRSGALAVKNYAWYQVLHWRGQTNAAGECFDLRDDTWDQVYDPSKATYSTAAAAVDATWSTLVLKNGAIFPTYYNAGSIGEGCGANANGWKAYQWGTQGCGLAGLTAAQIILTYYYPSVTVSGAPAASPTPTPVPTASPMPTAPPTATPTPTPQPTSTSTGSPTPAPSSTSQATPTPTPQATPQPTAVPTAVPTTSPTPQPTPLPTPPPDQQLPGGGQSGVENSSAPPPPPPPAPDPVVVESESDAGASAADALVAARWSAGMTRLFAADSALLADARSLTAAGRRIADMHAVAGTTDPGGDLRLAAFDVMWEDAVEQLLVAVARELQAIPAPQLAGAAAGHD